MASDAGLLAVSQYVVTGLGLVTTIFVARLLGSAEYGMIAMGMAYPAFLLSFASIKSMSITTRYISSFYATQQYEALRRICKLGYLVDLLVALTTFLVVTATSRWVAQYLFHMPDLAELMMLYAASFPVFSLVGTSRAMLSSCRKFGWLAGLQVLEKVVTLFVVIGLVLAGFGPLGVIVGTAVGHISGGVIMVVGATQALRRAGIGVWWTAPLGGIAAPLRKELSTAFGWNYLTVTLNGCVDQIPLMLLGHLRGPEEAGFYRLALSLVTAGSYLESSLRRVVYPVLSARWDEGARKSLGQTLKRWTLHGGLPVGTCIFLTIPLFPNLIPVVFGPTYHPMVFGTQVMMAGVGVSAVFFWLHSFYYASGQIGFWAKAYSVYATVSVGLAWLCVRGWGFSGLAGLIAGGKVIFIASMVAILLPRRRYQSESICLSKQN